MRERLVSVADLASERGRPGRWIYSRSGICRLSRTADFPEPVCVVSRGRIKVWQLRHVMDYERWHPEVLLTEQRKRKRRQWRVIRPPVEVWQGPAMPWTWSLLNGNTCCCLSAHSVPDDPPGLAPADVGGMAPAVAA